MILSWRSVTSARSSTINIYFSSLPPGNLTYVNRREERKFSSAAKVGSYAFRAVLCDATLARLRREEQVAKYHDGFASICQDRGALAKGFQTPLAFFGETGRATALAQLCNNLALAPSRACRRTSPTRSPRL